MKRRAIIITAIMLLAALVLFTAAFASAEEEGRPEAAESAQEPGQEPAQETGRDTAAEQSEVSIPDDTPVTYGYFKAFREQIKREIIEELRGEGGLSDYRDLALTRGDVIVPAPGCEIIFRGGSAVVITSSDKAGDGIKDLSLAEELFSGEALVYGHIYRPAESGAEKAIIITGGTALLTVRGEYEIR
ncbi:MAG: hypothetical protein IK047_05510 [Clostridia bacterium]|nr:hypothetical protein [Clostridia bacterium]